MPTRPARLNCRSCRSADDWWTQSSIRSIERRSFWKRWLASKSKKAISGVTSRSFELWCRIVLNTLPSRTNRSSCAWSWTRSWSRTGELMCTTTFRFLDLPPRGKRKCQPISICVTHVMTRLKALYRGWAIPCAGTQVYAPHYRSEWLAKIHEAGVRRRAEFYYQQLDALADGASGSAAGAVGGGQETPGLETTLPDSCDRPDPVRRTAWHSADPASFPHQEAAVDVQRFWHEGAIRDTLERFEAAGSPVVTDGEQRKYHNFCTYCAHGLPNTESLLRSTHTLRPQKKCATVCSNPAENWRWC